MQAGQFARIAGLTSALCACASTGGPRYSEQPATDSNVYDATKVAVVTEWAKTKGATVIWINYPTKPKPRDGG